MSKQTVECDNCQTVVRRWPNNISEHNFCDWNCYLEWIAENRKGESHPRYSRVVVECDHCGSELERIPARVEEDRHAFCDMECKGAYIEDHPEKSHERNRITVECENCGAELKRIQYDVDRSERFFCDPECRGEWQSEHITGDDHPNWQGGFDRYYGENWYTQRRRTKRRDGHQCFLCGLSEAASLAIRGRGLDIHHVRRKEAFTDLEEANRLGNLLTLCAVCHSRIDDNTTPP